MFSKKIQALICLLLINAPLLRGAMPSFVATHLDDTAQEKTMEFSGAQITKVAKLLGYEYPQKNLVYWEAEGMRAWLLDGRGRSGRFQAAFVVAEGKIIHCEVIQYIGSHGKDITQASYLKQFRGAFLKGGDNRLDRRIDAVSGATISSAAMEKLARIALVLDADISQQNSEHVDK
jgi:hypothetical protein